MEHSEGQLLADRGATDKCKDLDCGIDLNTSEKQFN
jgi:hypothetical protein